jgi:predicted nucleic acid-binding protein
MVDTNAFLYFLLGECNKVTVEIFKLSYLKKLKLVTTSRVVDELLFKAMIIKAKEKYGIEKNVVEKLKRNKKLVKELSGDIKEVLNFLKNARVKVVELKISTLRSIPDVMYKYGLFGNDALILKTMKELNLKFLLTTDKDFKEIEDIEIINPL